MTPEAIKELAQSIADAMDAHGGTIFTAQQIADLAAGTAFTIIRPDGTAEPLRAAEVLNQTYFKYAGRRSR